MVRTRALRFLLILGLIALLLPVSLAQADGHEGSGTATIRDAVIGGDPFAGDTPVTVRSGRLVLAMSGVEALSDSDTMALEGWLVSDDGERKQSIGILEIGEDGSVNHEFVADPGENLFAAFDKAVVTLEAIPDTDPEPSAETVFSGMLLEGVRDQVRALHVPGEEGTPPALGLVEQVELALVSARHARGSASTGDLEMARTHAACAVGIIQGSADCGDGVGVGAYADAVIAAAVAAKEAAEAAEPVDEAAAKASDDTIAAATSARDRAQQAVAAAGLGSDATNSQVATLHMGNVVDHLGDNGASGAAASAYTSSQDIGSYAVGAPKLPATGEPLIPQMARYGLIGSIVLVVLGSALFFGTRRRSEGSGA